MSTSPPVPVVRLLGPSGSGKTTLGERLIALLTDRGHRVASIKNAIKHPAPPDRARSDTRRYVEAGVLASVGRFSDGVVISLPHADLEELLAMLRPIVDVVIVEGFHEHDALPTLVFRVEGLRAPDGGAHVLATIVADPSAAEPPAVLHRDDIEGVAAIVEHWLQGAQDAQDPAATPVRRS